MSKFVLIPTILLIAATSNPCAAQDDPKLNVNFGAGVTTPLNPTAQYAGLSGNFLAGVGYNINRKHALIGEFLWAGLPPNRFVIHPVDAPFGNINLYSLTANYRYQFDRIARSRFGVYTILGGGWYYRYSTVDKNYVAPPFTVCAPVYTYWGYACDDGGYVYSQTVAYKGRSAGGVNAGLGFTIGISDSGWKIFMESRYHYAWHDTVPTTLIPVTFGIRFN
jgi:hypothetical protein